MQRRSVLTSLLALCAAPSAWADGVSYTSARSLATEGAGLRFSHAHDWSGSRPRDLFFDLAHHDRFFTTDNDFAHVALETADGQPLWRAPSPALTRLWIAPDGAFVVGLSNVMLYNPAQLAVWQRDGTLMHREHISARVAHPTNAQWSLFTETFPEAARVLGPRVFHHRGGLYVDHGLLGMRDLIGSDAWTALQPWTVPHPYSSDFSSSVTNWIEWFDTQDPGAAMAQSGRDGGPWQQLLRSPQGHPMRIDLA